MDNDTESTQNPTPQRHHYPQPGDRIRITAVLPQDPDPLPISTTGTVTEVHQDVRQIHVDWDITSSLMLLPTDPFEILPKAKTPPTYAGHHDEPEEPNHE